MIVRGHRSVLLSRRLLLGYPVVICLHTRSSGETLASLLVRDLVVRVDRAEGLHSPLTLGIARVVLRPGASVVASTPNGARMIVVESGVLAITATSEETRPFTSTQLALDQPPPKNGDELFVPAGTAVTFGSIGVSRVRNPGDRPVVALDAAVFQEQPRPIARAFTTDEGISFQLLASASAEVAPQGPVAVILERVHLGAQVDLPVDLTRGLTLAYLEAGAIELRPRTGEAFAARAAAATPYSMPGSLQAIPIGETRGITAGGVVFLPVGAESGVANVATRAAELLILAVREIA